MIRTVSGTLLALIALGSALGQTPPPAQTPPQTQPAAPSATGVVNFSNQPLTEVIDVLARELHINYILDSAVKGGTVTINTYGTGQGVELLPLFETILRMNNLAMVKAGDIYRIVPIGNIARQPISPVNQNDPSSIPDDEREMLNLVFLRFATSGEMAKVLAPFIGDGGQVQSYDPANLLIILDNSRNMKRTLELVSLFDSESFAGQRVRAYEVKNGRPSDIAKDLDEVFKAYALSTGKDHGAVEFIAINRVNTILAVAPNPGAFNEVDKWITKFDIVPKSAAGSIQNNVYKLKYQRAEILGSVITQLYGGCAPIGGGYGAGYGIPGNSSYPAAGYASGYSGGGGYGAGGAVSPYGGASPYGAGGSPYGGASPYGGGAYGGGAYGGGYGGGVNPNCYNQGAYGQGYGAAAGTSALGAFTTPTAPAGQGAPNGTAAASTPAGTDQTGSYLTGSAITPGQGQPRIVPNPFDNTLIVQSTPEQWESIRSLLDKLDVSPRQVLIDAKIYEVTLTGAFSAGVEAYLQQKGATNAAGITSTQLLGSNNSGFNATTILSAGTLVGQSRQLLALLQLQETRSRTKVLSAPSVIATDSIPASITVGDSVPTLTSQAVNAGVTSGGNSLFTQTISNTSTGIGLNILARVNSSGIVTMVINQDVTAPEANTASNIDSPSFSQRNVSTQVTVQDGDTVAIGGIIMESTTESSSGIPLLDRIPYLGAAFGNKSNSKTRTELLIFLTPRVIYDTNQISDASEELKERLKGLKKSFKDQ